MKSDIPSSRHLHPLAPPEGARTGVCASAGEDEKDSTGDFQGKCRHGVTATPSGHFHQVREEF
jgi:hypothetical protein